MLFGLLLSSFSSALKDDTKIIWSSKQYIDKSRIDSIVKMANEFTCTQTSLSWPLFGGELPVTEVEWNLNADIEGTILYRISGGGMEGTVFFDFRQKKARVNLSSEVGLIDFELNQETYSIK